MGSYARAFGLHAPEVTYTAHGFDEQLFDTGEVMLNYATTETRRPPLLLIPGRRSRGGVRGGDAVVGQTVSGCTPWTYAVRADRPAPGPLRAGQHGQRPGAFPRRVVGRPALVSGLSSGGVLAAWLSAYAKPGQLIGAHYEDPPLFSSELNPVVGQSIRQGLAAVRVVLRSTSATSGASATGPACWPPRRTNCRHGSPG